MNIPTPGPWSLNLDDYEDDNAFIETQSGGLVAILNEARECDLRLIAAAPDLLNALKAIASYSFDPGAAGTARDAIKKAMGE